MAIHRKSAQDRKATQKMISNPPGRRRCFFASLLLPSPTPALVDGDSDRFLRTLFAAGVSGLPEVDEQHPCIDVEAMSLYQLAVRAVFHDRSRIDRWQTT